ncbi:class I SAM-dependent methyltransferase [Pseudobacter ginsenosidimutans]|uniref:Putative nicotinamide N-methyase n=1 Tax=Pseudobacter ginsenosidimutans TaxID=661488 RepID=A0A4Q7N5I7_9BACT|nr:methyltransferase domain-containing protein [Pseudobacter ginsenosidimutans]QEC44825.1 methyltransferase domain-containing protein [Pseudobacter ginsenosidimutans]RZS76315.1 putative nicotinamide N-methyase [Pseudobacter ginsenosidimutans]
MSVTLQLKHIVRPGYSVELFVPDAQEVQESYFQQKKTQDNIPFPHWTRLWPSSLAMADFIHQHSAIVENKHVLELAAGLGLPGFVSAPYAKSVCCSDYLEEAVITMDRSAKHLQLSNVTCRLLDWNQLPEGLSTDVLLLSDINYDPGQFDRLYQVLQKFFQQGTTILLTTPQRLMAKPFIERLLPDCKELHEVKVERGGQEAMISLLLM